VSCSPVRSMCIGVQKVIKKYFLFFSVEGGFGMVIANYDVSRESDHGKGVR